jgi:hypothetical protein
VLVDRGAPLVGPSNETSWKTARFASAGCPGRPAISPSSERPSIAASGFAPARFASVGRMSMWPTGMVTLLGATPGTRTMKGTLVCAEYRW